MAVPAEERLHKGPGVRRPDLAIWLTEGFAERLHVFSDDKPEEVLAKVIWQLSAVINHVVSDPKSTTLLRTMYNLDRDPEINTLGLSERLKVLYRRHGQGWHPSTTNTKLSELRLTLLHPELKTRRFDWPPDNEIAALARSEARYAVELNGSGLGMFVLPKDTLGQMIADLNGTGRRGLERALPQADLHFSVSSEGNLVTTATSEFGENLPAFTSAALLRQYQDEVRAPESDIPTLATGRVVVDILVARGRVGLAVNPLGGHGGHGGQLWTPEELMAL